MRLKFWIKQGIDTFLLILGASALYGFLMFIQTDSGWDGLLILLPLYQVSQNHGGHHGGGRPCCQ